jgi:hypothetical protein
MAALKSYEDAGIERVLILADDDACEDCKALADSPMIISGAIIPPIHEGCRCAIAAHVE